MSRSIGLRAFPAGLLLVVLFAGTTLVAQSTSAIQGTVEDSQGAVMPGVTLVVTNAGTGLERTVQSDSNGLFVVPALPPGRYRVQAHISGFQDQTQETD